MTIEEPLAIRQITVTESVVIPRPPEQVWDFTQDYRRRPEWDASVMAAEVLAGDGPPRVRVRMRGGVDCVFQYKVFDRPRRTSLAMSEVRSWLLAGGGGAWTYDAVDGGTRWTQHNTIVFRNAFLGVCFGAIAHWQLARSTRRAMLQAQRLIVGRGRALP